MVNPFNGLKIEIFVIFFSFEGVREIEMRCTRFSCGESSAKSLFCQREVKNRWEAWRPSMGCEAWMVSRGTACPQDVGLNSKATVGVVVTGGDLSRVG